MSTQEHGNRTLKSDTKTQLGTDLFSSKQAAITRLLNLNWFLSLPLCWLWGMSCTFLVSLLFGLRIFQVFKLLFCQLLLIPEVEHPNKSEIGLHLSMSISSAQVLRLRQDADSPVICISPNWLMAEAFVTTFDFHWLRIIYTQHPAIPATQRRNVFVQNATGRN